MIAFSLPGSAIKLRLNGTTIERWYKADRNVHKEERWKTLALRSNTGGYLYIGFCENGKTKNILHHRLIYYIHNQDWDIWDISKDNKIDHKNRNKQDNSIENLQVTTQQKNCFNTKAKGYYKHKNGKFVSQICVNYKVINLGYYHTEDEARDAYLRGKSKYHND